MASSSSSSSSFSLPSSPNATITADQLRSFHNIDRILFTRLMHNLGRSPVDSMQAIALWIWLEHAGQCRDLVYKMLKCPDVLLASLADEALLCLSCVEGKLNDEDFSRFLPSSLIQLPLTQSITKSMVSLSFFLDNQLNILHGVAKTVNQVCARAFEDLVLRYQASHDTSTMNLLRGSNNEIAMNKNQNHYYGLIDSLPVMSHNYFQGYHEMIDPSGYEDVRQHDVVFKSETDEMLKRLQIGSMISDQGNDHVSVAPSDERTVFLTFSKGYPISENEIRDFITRKFGECFEAIHMQEVGSTMEQPLYARLVLLSSSLMDMVLDGKSKAKFSINGKHVWARKYVRKNHRSPPQPSSPSA